MYDNSGRMCTSYVHVTVFEFSEMAQMVYDKLVGNPCIVESKGHPKFQDVTANYHYILSLFFFERQVGVYFSLEY